jgi:Gas vesicle protein K/Gas vesicle protein
VLIVAIRRPAEGVSSDDKGVGQVKMKTSEQVIENRRFTILELLDRLLDKGAVVKGEILLSVADIDLVYLNLGLLLSSVKTVEQAARGGKKRETTLLSWQSSPQAAFVDEPLLETGAIEAAPAPLVANQRNSVDEGVEARGLLPAINDDDELEPFSGPSANIDPNNVEKGLAQLVLTLVELIRKLMEKQAVRRIGTGQLSADEIERMGNTFLLLHEKMEQLKETFGLQDEDLNLDLGPLGELL